MSKLIAIGALLFILDFVDSIRTERFFFIDIVALDK